MDVVTNLNCYSSRIYIKISKSKNEVVKNKINSKLISIKIVCIVNYKNRNKKRERS